MKKTLVVFAAFGLMIMIAASSFAQTPKLWVEIEKSDDAGLAFKDSVENVDKDTPLYISVYGSDFPAMLGYTVELSSDFSIFKDNNVDIIAGRTGDENPFGSSSSYLVIPVVVNSTIEGNDRVSISVVSSDGVTATSIADTVWAFLGRFAIETSSDFKLPGDFYVFEVTLAEYVPSPSGAEVAITEHNPAYMNVVTNVEDDDPRLPVEYNLGNNYPNPFNPSTTIPFDLIANGNVKIVVMNLIGQEVEEIVNGFYSAGSHTVRFNAQHLSTGIYFYRMEVNGFVSIKKFVLIR